nr:MAG: ORF1 [TTV-like mini virus]
MPPFYNYYNRYRRPWRQRRRRRLRFRPRRTRKTLRRKRRSYYWVRRKRFLKNILKKLKTIKLKQFQPEKVRKCRIKGYLELFEGSYGRTSNNFTLWKESYVPPHEPGGGGWTIQQLGLGNLFTQHEYKMNTWTKSNNGYNLCRYLGVTITLFRQPKVDYIFTYNLEEPRTITKYTYASYHPFLVLQYPKKIIVPSFESQPLKKTLYKKKFIRPPKKLTNQWYFQQQLSNTELLTFYASAIDLRTMFIPPNAKNNNITLNALNTRLYTHPVFQYYRSHTTGFTPDNTKYLWGLQHAPDPPSKTKMKQWTFLGDTRLNDPGQPLNDKNFSQYKTDLWGNPFYFDFLLQDSPVILVTEELNTIITQHKERDVETSQWRTEPQIIPVRYNPNKDKGTGNIVYWLNNYDATQKNWDPPKDESLVLRNLPLWLAVWGFEDYVKKTGKIHTLDENGLLVIRSNYLSDSLPAYVFLSDEFIHGQGPYGIPAEEMTTYTRSHWFPRWKFQKPQIEEIAMTGPAVYNTHNTSFQAHMKYNFFFKWGGNPATMEQVADPNSQPAGPDPHSQLLSSEIISPTTPFTNYIYTWDVRRDILTAAAAKRIKEISTDEQYLFSDGTATSTDIPYPKATQTTQAETTTEEEEQALFQQLLQLQQHNQQLQQRFRQLKQLLEET